MQRIPVSLTVRGQELSVHVPGPDAPPEVVFAESITMMITALVAMANPDVDRVLAAWGYSLIVNQGDREVVIFPPPKAQTIPRCSCGDPDSGWVQPDPAVADDLVCSACGEAASEG